MTQGGNIWALGVALGIFVLISIPGLIWVWRRMFSEEEPRDDQFSR